MARLLSYIARRLLLAVLVVVSVSVVTFVVSRVLPSDPAALYAGARPTAQQIERVRQQMGLDQPLPVQFGRYLSDILHGDLGVSFRTRQPIAQELLRRLPATLELVIAGTLLALIVGVPMGVLSAARSGTVFDHAGRLLAMAGVSIPSFWLALLFQLLFFGRLKLLPLAGRIDTRLAIQQPVEVVTGFYLLDTMFTRNWAAWQSAASHLILPALVLSIYPMSVAVRMTRSTMLEVLSQGYITAARAMGLPERSVLFRSALKNAIIPTLTVTGLSFAWSITGAFMIEVVFNWPGVGKYVADAILTIDYPVIVAVTAVVAVFYVIVNLVVDLATAAIDPRIKLGQ
jgi:peptide/nickel transport system permease protein